ncbi:response regulator [Aporhodopirellula aestuarii]|uniref:Response regulator n=1 Tax=Aporhodopirellula aestuarii TaxID=2950107 RepID=A0ABT0U1X1_9BACT|nr:response regulator [Aporhodopirellula aestuarii]MCM2370555.1 response regulator [Aporhodopirellula aestuarii]
MSIKFTQSCPTCGRRIDIRASLLGCTVACQHCGAEFTANANEQSRIGREPTEDLLDRVEKALRRAEEASMVGANSEVTP